VVLDADVLEELESACDRWAGTEIAWEAIEWALCRDPDVGRALNEGGSERAFVYIGARSIHQPDIEVTYVVEGNEIVVKIAEFADAKASYAGRA
jgi:hypothetical protein